MADVFDLKQQLSDVMTQLDSLQKTRTDLEHQIIIEEKKLTLNNFDKWDISSGYCLVLFAKEVTNYCLVKLIKIKEVDLENQRIRTVLGSYIDYDGIEYCFSIDYINFSSLDTLLSSYNIYVVDDVTAASLNQHLCELEITRSNVHMYEERYKKAAIRTIK